MKFFFWQSLFVEQKKNLNLFVSIKIDWIFSTFFIVLVCSCVCVFMCRWELKEKKFFFFLETNKTFNEQQQTLNSEKVFHSFIYLCVCVCMCAWYINKNKNQKFSDQMNKDFRWIYSHKRYVLKFSLFFF